MTVVHGFIGPNNPLWKEYCPPVGFCIPKPSGYADASPTL